MDIQKFIDKYLPEDKEINKEREESWNKDHPGFSWKKDVSKSVEHMKKHPRKIDNPWALRQWQILPKFKKEREEAARKAASSRK